jgi:hypothetical protein
MPAPSVASLCSWVPLPFRAAALRAAALGAVAIATTVRASSTADSAAAASGVLVGSGAAVLNVGSRRTKPMASASCVPAASRTAEISFGRVIASRIPDKMHIIHRTVPTLCCRRTFTPARGRNFSVPADTSGPAAARARHGGVPAQRCRGGSWAGCERNREAQGVSMQWIRKISDRVHEQSSV